VGGPWIWERRGIFFGMKAGIRLRSRIKRQGWTRLERKGGQRTNYGDIIK
jgi:hypothetical protein